MLGLRFVRGLSLVAASGGHSSSRCAGLSLSRPLLLRSTGSRRTDSAVVAHGPSCSAACGIFPDQGSNPCPLHWQADFQPLHHQGSPNFLLNEIKKKEPLSFTVNHPFIMYCAQDSYLWIQVSSWPHGLQPEGQSVLTFPVLQIVSACVNVKVS